MAFIEQEEINRIRNSASIVDIISSYVPLTQKGKNYFGVCPFHDDHSPSMSVSEEKQIYKCFSCGATGNVFTFVESFLNISFAEAVSLVANKIGLSLSVKIEKKEDTKFKDEYALMDFAQKFYQNNLNTEAGQKAIDYLKKRDLFADTITNFNIGLALDQNSLYTILSKKGYSDKMLEDVGLINQGENGLKDVFQNRIMFPIHNLEGKVVGFTARCYLSELTPKYLNTKETFLFKKGNILFNYHRALDAVRISKELIVVEGNMDAIRMYSNGFKNVVALMGTAMTKEQIEIFKKLRCKIILMLDNDEAGETATLHLGELLEENHIAFLVVRLSGEKDPDSYIIKNGVEKMQEALKGAISFIDFKLNYFKKNKNLNDATDLAEYIKVVIDSLKSSNDIILKEVTLQKLSKDYNISYAILKEQLGLNEAKETSKKVKIISKEPENKNSYDKICSKILYYMMNDLEYIKLYQTKLGIFPTKEYRAIANEIVYYYEKNKSINLADFISFAENNTLKEEIMAIIKNEKDLVLTENGLLELLDILKKKAKKEEINKLKQQIKEEYDINKKIVLLEKITELKKENE